MILLDTTVLVYAVGEDHPLKEPCRRILAAHGDGVIQATTTIEVIQEFAHVYARRRDRAAAVTLANRYADALAPVETRVDDLRAGLDLYASHPELGAFDSVLAAVSLRVGVEALVSADRAFQGVAGLRWLTPSPEMLAALR